MLVVTMNVTDEIDASTGRVLSSAHMVFISQELASCLH
jgi:hypothetical protein